MCLKEAVAETIVVQSPSGRGLRADVRTGLLVLRPYHQIQPDGVIGSSEARQRYFRTADLRIRLECGREVNGSPPSVVSVPCGGAVLLGPWLGFVVQ
jgi:hypothetical protein